ncbi:hypothetical protein G3570_06410 [Balneolaceae bacterium YR4-1]|uniref:CbaC protein n=1 Tax=Halalkalibaculum roseum TaxID=2709311 RepID=A0A6M1T0H3_9BACT|nr:hypothetical protein [Halalkalibaculum roseum]NGP76257.1 hypothetical protein [Halalkalibaculum roseum]
MNKKSFFEIAFGAALGIVLYQLIFQLIEAEGILEENFIVEVIIMAAFAFSGILLVQWISSKFFRSKE